MLIGIIILIYPKIVKDISQKRELKCIKNYKTSVENTEEEYKNSEYEKAMIYNETLNGNIVGVKNDEYNNILNLSQNGVMAYIEITKISVYLPIYHGTQDSDLKQGIGHIENTSFPIGGKSTHCVLVGHTGLIKSKIFTRLKELQIGEEVNIYTLDKKIKYKVYQTKVVLPQEANEFEIQENKDILTLVTCTPIGINTHRLLVECERMDDDVNALDEKNEEEFRENKEKYHLTKNVYILIIALIVIFCCILLNKIVKYIQKVRKRK